MSHDSFGSRLKHPPSGEQAKSYLPTVVTLGGMLLFVGVVIEHVYWPTIVVTARELSA